MTYKDKASYDTTPPRTNKPTTEVFYKTTLFEEVGKSVTQVCECMRVCVWCVRARTFVYAKILTSQIATQFTV